MKSHQKKATNPPSSTLQAKGPAKAAPTFQLQASSKAKSGDEKKPLAPGVPMGTLTQKPNYNSKSVDDLVSWTKRLDSVLQDTSLEHTDKFIVARNLVSIYEELVGRSLSANHEKPDASNPIWKLYGGVGDPLASWGQLESFAPFRKVDTWRSVMRSNNPGGWEEEHLHAAYLGGKSPRTGERRGFARAGNTDNEGHQVEHFRDRIGKEGVDEFGIKGTNEIKSATDWASDNEGKLKKGVMRNPDFELTPDVLINNILKTKHVQVGSNVYKLDDYKGKIQEYLDQIKNAMRLAKIDTVRAQAMYIAHACGETFMSILTEGQATGFDDDVDNMTFQGAKKGGFSPHEYAEGGNLFSHSKRKSIDPLNRLGKRDEFVKKSKKDQATAFRDTFIGRGPVQVTHDYGYVRTLVYLEELAKTAEPKDADYIMKAVADIKRDPSLVGKQEYAFLFSAAYMHHAKGVSASGTIPLAVNEMPEMAKLGPGASEAEKNQTFMTGGQKALLDWVSGGLRYVRGIRKGTLDKNFFKKGNFKIRVYNRTVTELTNIWKTKYPNGNPKP